MKLKVALLCGGPSLERGISLNSSRSVLDHLAGDDIEICPFYFDHKKNPYQISPSQLYSNTPSDFDFKLQQTAKPLTQRGLVRALAACDIVFPVMHGPFGEDGDIQSFLEKHQLPYVGSSADTCKRAFDKFIANEFIRKLGFFTLPSTVLKIFHRDHRAILTRFFKENHITRAVVKPATGGSSIGVFSVSTVSEALDKAETIFSKRMDTRVVVEPFARGREFTVIILQNRFNLPVAILPTEIEADYSKHQIFDFRKKYLPTRQVTYHCPPRFDGDTIERIQAQAEQLFSALGMRDFARFDGWVLDDGNIWFSDFNPISGMEQNSFLFQQSTRVGLSHRDILRFIVSRACARQGIPFPASTSARARQIPKSVGERKAVHILFGGKTSERQVSLMSGTNVWLKLRKSKRYDPKPFLLDVDGNVWEVPYALTLNHTVEEITANCVAAEGDKERLAMLERRVRRRLALSEGESSLEFFVPKKISLDDLMHRSGFIFIALHGGLGENGALQEILEKKGVLYNGPDSKVSALCMDKWQTAELIRKLDLPGVSTADSKVVSVPQSMNLSLQDSQALWRTLVGELKSSSLIIKPLADGCSSGIVRLFSSEDLRHYFELMHVRAPCIPAGTFKNQAQIVQMPAEEVNEVLLEHYVETDIVRVKGNSLKHIARSGWIEVTVGVVQDGRHLRVLNPSLTVAEGEVLSVEEKFQGGTGINITPPPAEIVQPHALSRAKALIGKVAEKFGIGGYSRIDAFLHCATGDVKIIEINTLPGLTPSTVLYHQGLAEKKPIFPMELLEKLIENKGY